MGAIVLFASARLAFADRADTQPIRGRTLDPPARPFSLGLEGMFQAAASYQLEAAAPAELPWTAGALTRLTPAAPEILPNVFAAPAAAVPPPGSRRRFLIAAGELALMEVLPWFYDRYIEDEAFARISWHTVSENFKAGFHFDSDRFEGNQSLHPFQGSLFFEAGRSNGFTYWESGLFALTGSLIWEFFMENSQPSTNDLINTTLGGMTRGEVQHRLAAMVLDNTATGSERFWRELGAAVLNPVGAITRLVEGDMGRSFPNPDDRLPDRFTLASQLGYRHVDGPVEDPDQGLIFLAATYGDPFAGEVRTPFEYFAASLELALPAEKPVTRFEERGILRSWDLTDHAASPRHAFALSQEYVYIHNDAEVFGAQMFSAGLLSRFQLPCGLVATTDLEALAVPLAAIQTTEVVNPRTGRNYDYGPGGGLLAALRLDGGGREILNAGYGVVWTHTVSGSSDDNAVQFFRATAVIPIAGPLGIGGGYRWYSRKSSFAGGFFEPRQTQSEWRAFLSLSFGASGLRKPKD